MDVSKKAEDAYPNSAPGPCSQFLVESELLIYFCYFVHVILVFFIMFFVVCVCFLCLVFVPGLIFFITARILVPFITLSKNICLNENKTYI